MKAFRDGVTDRRDTVNQMRRYDRSTQVALDF